MSNKTNRGNPNHPMNRNGGFMGIPNARAVQHQIVVDVYADGQANCRCSSQLTMLSAARILSSITQGLIQQAEQQTAVDRIDVPDSTLTTKLLEAPKDGTAPTVE